MTISQCERGVTSTAVFPTVGGGSTPSRSLQALIVEECSSADVRTFIEEHHYMGSIAGVTPSNCFKVMLDGRLVGAAIFGLPAMREPLEKYSEFGKYKLLELRRFVMVDDTPRNAESKSIAVMLRILQRHGVQRILSYADPTYGHVGTIYKALGFLCLGQNRGGPDIDYQGRRVRRSSLDRYHRWSTRALNRYKNYENKAAGLTPFAKEIREALKTGEAVKKKDAGKFIYIKDLISPAQKRRSTMKSEVA